MQKIKLISFYTTLLLLLSIVCFIAVVFNHYQTHYVLLKKVSLTGGTSAMHNSTKELVDDYINKPLLTISLEELAQQIELLPGIAKVHIQRIANKQSLLIELFEHKPLAQWKAGGMVDIYGQIYFGYHDRELPIFHAPSVRAVEITEFYDSVTKILAKDDIAQVELSDQGEWRLFLQNGIILRLGKDKPLTKLRTYVKNSDALISRFATLHAVDLRYDKGFSIVYDQQEAEPK